MSEEQRDDRRHYNSRAGEGHRPTVQPATPMVSVIIPCYRQAHFLSDALESVLAQTHPRLDILVVDDGSPDNTAEVAAHYPGVRCVRQENGGLSTARNAGFRASRGEYIMFLDADDRLTPIAVEAHLRGFERHPEAGFVVGDINHIAVDGSDAGFPRWPLLEANQYEELLKVNHVANTIAVMFRRSALETLGEFDRSLAAAADYEMLLRAARSFPSAHHRTVVAQYRRHQTSMSRNGLLMLRTTLGVMRSQRPFVIGNAALEAALRRGENRWRAVYGPVVAQDIRTHLACGDLPRAAEAVAVLFWSLAVFSWQEPARVLNFAGRRLRHSSKTSR